ncbi:hypothetical protein BJY52DRAFT_1419721 [Lactarius psammicola]|nr:hypothetical protein BJY52DRAFT_1419721 [Lactarius psammicola]
MIQPGQTLDDTSTETTTVEEHEAGKIIFLPSQLVVYNRDEPRPSAWLAWLEALPKEAFTRFKVFPKPKIDRIATSYLDVKRVPTCIQLPVKLYTQQTRCGKSDHHPPSRNSVFRFQNYFNALSLLQWKVRWGKNPVRTSSVHASPCVTSAKKKKKNRSTGREGRKGCPPQSVRARPSPGLRPTQLAHPPVLARTLPFACGPRPGYAPPRSHTLPSLRACRDTAVAVQPLPNPPASVAPALVLCAPLARTDSRPSCAYTRRAEGCARCEVREPGCGVWVREQGCRGGASVCAKGGRACVRGWRSPCGGCWGSRCPPAHPFARKRERARGRRNGPPREGDLNKRVGGVYCPLTVPLIRVARPFPSTHARPFHTDRECAKVSLAWRPVASPSRALPLSRERVRRGTARPPTPSARATPTPHARPTPLRANRCATPAPLFPHPHPAPRFSHLAPRTPLCASGVGAGRAGVGARKGGTQNEGRCNTSRRIRQGLHRYRRVPACAQRR